MWIPWQWASASNERAIANARLGTTECSRRRLERAEVELFLAGPLSGARALESPGLTPEH